jgi:hypothetical protein
MDVQYTGRVYDIGVLEGKPRIAKPRRIIRIAILKGRFV